MNNKKILIYIILIIFLILAITLIFNKYRKNKNAIIATDYTIPLVSDVISNMENIEVKGGVYKYGDVNQDGSIDEYDKKMIELMINSNLNYTDEEKKLGDFNRDGNIDENDLNDLDKFLTKNSIKDYDPSLKKIEYCITEVNDSSTCQWQKNADFTKSEEKEYYVFVKDEEKISNVYIYNHKLIDIEKKMRDIIIDDE